MKWAPVLCQLLVRFLSACSGSMQDMLEESLMPGVNEGLDQILDDVASSQLTASSRTKGPIAQEQVVQ